jgi:hypothetical protein
MFVAQYEAGEQINPIILFTARLSFIFLLMICINNDVEKPGILIICDETIYVIFVCIVIFLILTPIYINSLNNQ